MSNKSEVDNLKDDKSGGDDDDDNNNNNKCGASISVNIQRKWALEY
jgi:hypothetical protein